MPPAFVQCNQSGNVGGSTTPTLTIASAQTAGHKNLVLVAWFDAAHTNSVSVKDSVNGSIYSIVGARYNDASGINPDFAFFETTSPIASAGAGVNVVTVTFGSAPAYTVIVACEYSGLVTAACGYHEAGAQSGAIPAAGPLVATIAATQAGDLVLVAGASIGSGANPTGISGPGTQRGSLLCNESWSERIAPTTSGQTFGFTMAAGSDNWNVIAAAFAAASSGIAVPFTVAP